MVATKSKPAKRRRPVETMEFLAMLRRMIRAAARRVGRADAEELAELLSIRDEMDEMIAKAVSGLRSDGYTDGSIAEALGVTRQAVSKRWPRT